MIRLRQWGPLAAVMLISCVPEVIVTPPAAGTVSVAVSAATITQGTTTQATATAVDTRGRGLPNEPRAWASSAPNVATVNASGLVTGVAPGTATISASVLGRSGSIAVTVVPAVASVSVTPLTASATYADTVRFTAAALASTGEAIPGKTFTWAIRTGAAFAAVSTAGLVTPVLQSDTVTRTVVVDATSDGRTGSATLTLRRLPVDTILVSPDSVSRVLGDTVRLTAVPRTRSGTTLTQRSILWSSANTAIATVNSSGLVTAVAPGKTVIRAASEGKTTSAVIVVTSRPVASIALRLPDDVSPVTTLSLGSGASQQLTAALFDANGSPLTGRTVSWASSVPAIVSVSSAGVVRAEAISGTVTVTASAEGRSTSVTVTVGNPTASVLTPVSLGVSVVQPGTLSATVRDGGAIPLANRVVTFRSTNSAVATVTPVVQSNASGIASGTVRGVGVGTALIIAAAEGRLDTTTVSVATAVVSQVTWNDVLAFLSPVTVGLSRDIPLAVTPRDVSGNAISGRSVTWSSSNPAAVSVSTAGVIRGIAAGSSVISAVVDGVSTSRSVSTQNPVASIVPSVTSDSVAVGGQVSRTITLRDAAGTTLSGRPFQAASADTSVVRVEITGASTIRLTGGRVGTTNVTVTAEGISSTIPVRTTAVSVASVVVTGSTALTRGGTSQLSATTRDAGGNLLTGRTVTWASSNTGVATVDPSGLVTGVAGGSATISATSGGVSGTLAITVSTDVASVTVSPGSFSLTSLGGTQTVTATVRNAAGVVLGERIVTWSSTNANVATVSATGVVTAIASGTASIRATVEGVTGAATATVSFANVCAPVAYTLGTAQSGTLASTDCAVSTGVVEDRYSFSTSTAVVVNWNLTSLPAGAAMRRIGPLQQGTTSPGQAALISGSATAPGPMGAFIFGAGTYVFAMRSASTLPIAYGFTAAANQPLPTTCSEVGVAIGGGFVLTRSLVSTACSSSGKYFFNYWTYLNAGQEITIANASSAYDTFLELWRYDGTNWVYVTSDDDSGDGTNSLLTFTPTTAGYYEIRTTSFDAGSTGASTLTVTASPVAVMAPSDGEGLRDDAPPIPPPSGAGPPPPSPPARRK